MLSSDSKEIKQKIGSFSECVTHAKKIGYTENFTLGEHGLFTEDSSSVFLPNDIVIRNVHRFETYDHSDKNVIVYLLETPEGRKGVLIDKSLDTRIAGFIKQVEEQQHRRPHYEDDKTF